MRLCFGTFAKVLNCCRQQIHITQTAFISRIAKIVDPKSIYQDYDAAISKLLHCERNFSFSDKENPQRPILDTIIREFETEITPFIDEDKKAKVILTLLGIIQKDSYIDTEKKATFQVYLGLDKQQLLQQSEYNISDFLSRLLLYTIYGNIDNCAGKNCINLITPDYIDSIAKPYITDYQWDISTQTLVLSFIKIFNIFNMAMLNNQIDDFIKQPVTYASMDFSWMQKRSSKWLDKCDIFLNCVENNIFASFEQSTNRADIMLEKIRRFTQILAEYSSFLKKAIPPINILNRNPLDPPNWEEYGKWTLYFEEQTQTYLQQLQSIHREIRNYALPCYIQ